MNYKQNITNNKELDEKIDVLLQALIFWRDQGITALGVEEESVSIIMTDLAIKDVIGEEEFEKFVKDKKVFYDKMKELNEQYKSEHNEKPR